MAGNNLARRRIGAPRKGKLAEFIAKYQAMGWTVKDFVGYERLTITHGVVNQIELFTTSMKNDGAAVTNFPKAGEVDKQSAFAFTHIAVDIEPAGNPAAFGAQAACNRINDAHYLASRGLLQISQGSANVNVLEVGPLRVLPGNAGLAGMVALADVSTTGASLQSRIQTVHTEGTPFKLNNPLLLPPGEVYNGKLDFGGSALSLPSTSNAEVLIRLHGIQFVRS